MAEMTIADAPAPAPAAGGIMRRLNVVTGLLAGLVLAGIGWAISHATLQNGTYGSDQVTCITLVCWLVGFLAGIGALSGRSAGWPART